MTTTQLDEYFEQNISAPFFDFDEGGVSIGELVVAFKKLPNWRQDWSSLHPNPDTETQNLYGVRHGLITKVFMFDLHPRLNKWLQILRDPHDDDIRYAAIKEFSDARELLQLYLTDPQFQQYPDVIEEVAPELRNLLEWVESKEKVIYKPPR